VAAATAEDIRLLVRLVRRDDAGIERCLRTRSAPLDQLCENAAIHGLSVVLLRALAGSPLRAKLSRVQLQMLEERRARQEERSTALLEALATLAQRFSSDGQEFLLLKGPYLATRFYGDVRGREFVDLDLLVPRADRPRTFRLLAAAGYSRRSRVLLGATLSSFFVHGFDFVAGDAKIDLHWCLSRHPSLRLDEGGIWAQRRSYQVDGRPYAVLSDEHEVVFAALSLLRDLERGRPKIKNVIDLVQILAVTDAALDWSAAFARAHREGTFGPLVNVLGLCLDVADAHDLAPHLSNTLAAHAARRGPVRPTESPLRFRPTWLGLGNKLWSARAHDTTLAGWILWWALSLPFRTTVHRWQRR